MKEFVKSLLEQEILVVVGKHVSSEKSKTYIQLSDEALVEKPFLSCLSVPVASLDSEYPYDFAILGMPFDLGSTGFPGSRFGPSRLRELSSTGADFRASFKDLSCEGWSSEYGKKYCEGKSIVDVGDVIHQVGEPFQSFFDRVKKTADVLHDRNAMPISIGGDHSCMHPLVCSAVSFTKKKIHLVVFDAHTDLADYDSDISHNHGNVVSRLLVEDVIQKVTHIGLRGMVGKPTIRDGYTPIYADQCLSSGEIYRLIPFDASEAVYVSFDVDVIDPAFAPGTGTPVPMGLTPQIVVSTIQQIFVCNDIVGFDIVEYSPMRDISDMTGNLLIHMLPKILDSLRSGKEVD
jgi:agmatinase